MLALLPILASCTGLEKAPPHSSKAALQEVASLQVASVSAFKQKDEQLQRIYYKVRIANLELCKNHTRTVVGARFDTISNHPKTIREAQAYVYGITNAISATSVVPGSVADQSGLRVGDQIVTLNGQKVGGENWIKRTLLPAIGRGGLLSITVKRPNGLNSIEMQPVKACSYPVELIYDNDITAITDGNRITVTTGAMRFFTSDDEIAFAIAHEMSHNLLGHVGSNQSYEYASDYLAGYLMERAGYNVRHGSHFFRRLAAEDPESIPLDRHGPHPSTTLRVILLDDLHTEIEKKREQNISLIPNITPQKSIWSIISNK